MKKALVFWAILCGVTTLLCIQVSGNQSGSWSPVNNPYEVVGDVTVPTGTTLTVLPGVIVQVMGNYQITAQGNIIALGTAADSIRFISGQPDVNALWKGIRLESTTAQSQFSYCRIEIGEYGINSINSPLSCTYSLFTRNKKGVQLYAIGAVNPSPATISHCKVEYSRENGILIVQNSNAVISYNEICRNSAAATFRGAIQLSNQSAGGSNSPLIHHNHIHHNYYQGIIAWDIVSAGAINAEIYDNLIEYNYTGLYLRHASGYVHDNTIRNNFIQGDMNSGAGVMVSGSTAQPYFERNTITGNYTGFYITENAQPCIGNLSIYHAWAQGENIIRNNIDANNVRHSVYCYNYTNSALTVYAENNYWDFQSAVEIAGTIEDNQDNPSLPTVDFTPWLNYIEPVFLSGMAVYLGALQIINPKLQLVSAATGVVLQEWDVVLNQPFMLPVALDSVVYVVVKASILGSSEKRYAAYGGTENPTATAIIANATFPVGDLIISDEPIWDYRRIGAPQWDEGHHIYPVRYGTFIYKYNYIDWLYQAGDYLYLRKHTRPLSTGEQTWNLPPNSTWLKVQNNMPNESFNRTEIMDTLGTVRITQLHYKGGMIQTLFGELFYQYDQSMNLLNQLTFSCLTWYNLYHEFHYAQNFVLTQKQIEPINVQNIGMIYPLGTGNFWKIRSQLPVLRPEFFGYNLNYPDYWGLVIHWKAPTIGQFAWSHYRIYRSDPFNNPNLFYLYDSVPFSQPWFYEPEFAIDGYWHLLYVTAFDGINESAPSDTIEICSVPVEDVTAIPPVISVYPNPLRLSRQKELTIKIENNTPTQGTLRIYNSKGQLVRNLLSERKANPQIIWDGKDANSRYCSSGIYFLKINVDKRSPVLRKILILK